VANQFVAAIDTKSPIVAITANPVAIKSSGTSIVTFTFSSSPTGFDATDVVYDATKGSLGQITGSGTTWTAVFTPSPTYMGEIAISIGAGAFTDANGNPNTAGASTTVTVDMVAPRVLSVSAPAGFYNADDVVTIAVLFSEPLFGDLAKLTLGLNSGAAGVSRVATWSATDPADDRIQLFSYRVADGDNARPLDYVSVNSLTGGPVTDLAGNTASLTLPTPGQGGALASSNVVIDTVAPTIVNVRANKTNVALREGDKIRIDLEFSEPLPYTPKAIPEINLVLNSGGTARQWTMIGDRTIRLIYTVGRDQNANPLDYFTVDALMIQPAIRNGVVTDVAGNTANLKLAAPGDARSLSRNSTVIVDTEVPELLGIRADKPDGSYTTPTVITLRAQFHESVKVDPTLPWPRLRLALPGERYATFDRVEGNDVLFRYEILPGDNTSRLDYFSTSALTGTISDLAGNVANLTLSSPGSTGSLTDDQAIVIDTTAPRVSGMSLVSAPGEYGPDSTIRFAVTMTEAVRVSGVPTIQLNTTPAGLASFASQSGDGRVLFFEYRPAMGDLANVLNPASALALAGGITDVAGNAAVLTLPTPVAQQSFGGPGVVAVDARIKVIGASSGISPTQPGPVFAAPLTTIDLQFNVPVTGVTLAALSVTYQGRPLSLAGASITGSGSTYRLTLPSTLTNLKGQYRLRIGGLASGIRAISNGAVMSPASNLYWQRVAAPKK
jgi:hypothetical protein